MISKQDLETIASNKLTSSAILFKNKKYDSSLYLVGYSIEMALKFKICKIFKLDKGFSENKSEFNAYMNGNDNDLEREINNLKEIRNHDLQKLLYYSGQEYDIKAELLDEWTQILYWTPELRYKINIGDKIFNQNVLKSVKKIVTLILK